MAGLEENPNAEILLEFVTESRETLERVEPLVIELEQGCKSDSETLAVIFRCFHSFKGTASFIDLAHTAGLAHSAESLLDLYRRGAEIEPSHVDLVCKALDTFREILDLIEVDFSDQGKAEECATLAAALDAVVASIKAGGGVRAISRGSTKDDETSTTAPTTQVPVVGAPPSTGKTMAAQRLQSGEDELDFFKETDPEPLTAALPEDFLIKFVTESDEHLIKVEEVLVAMERGEVSDEQLADAFRAMHSFKGNCGICGYADMEALTHKAETLMGDFRDKKRVPNEHSTSFMLETLDVLRSALSTLPRGDAKIPTLAALLQRMDGLELATPTGAAMANIKEPSETQSELELRPEAKTEPKNEHGGAPKNGGSIRVDTVKLDDLMNLVGELIIAETTVTKNPDLEGHEFENFQKAALNLNRITRALQDITMAVRMVPIASTFRKMVRLVRDVSTKQKKRVELMISGEETEVDKTVVETIADPLVHLVRNSIDHGLEGPEERMGVSKEPVGKVWLDAKHQGGEVWITIRDDGRGLNPERILKKAIEKGIADPVQRYSEREIFEFIFAPGFSTAPQITEISGRGVGMDVVRRNIEAVNGRVDVTSELGAGATFTLRIPLTLAIIEGMLVRVGGSYYTIPLLAIRESVKAQGVDITTLSDGCELLKLRRRHYPIIRLSQVHGVRAGVASALDGILVIVESGERLACILVDEVVGQRQTVIKPLPEYLKRVRGLAGCSILHNGEISLILDVEGVIGSVDSRAA